jgi:hypothetical protein
MVPPEPQSAFFLVTEVASASREQTHGINQINLAVGQVDKVTQSNAASAEESAAAEELSSQVIVMKESVRELLHLVGGDHSRSLNLSAPIHAPAPTHAATSKNSQVSVPPGRPKSAAKLSFAIHPAGASGQDF